MHIRINFASHPLIYNSGYTLANRMQHFENQSYREKTRLFAMGWATYNNFSKRPTVFQTHCIQTNSIGSYVLVNIKKVDYGPPDTKNIIGKVIDKKKNNVYQIGTWFGIINMRLSRDVLHTTDTEFLDEVLNTIITSKETTKRRSKFGEQGYRKCFYKTSCKTNIYACQKNNVLSNLRCHEKTLCNETTKDCLFFKSLTAVSLYTMNLKNSMLFGKIIMDPLQRT
ncbi:hypothetical protein QTP88_018957 [Uroleucon formosanum]